MIFPRAHFLFKPGTAPSTNPIDPGFGYGTLRWPQIDKPNAAQSAWNAAVKTKAERLPVDLFAEKSSTPKNATFDTFVDAGGSIDAYYTIQAANDRFIDVTFTDGIFNWGAAHPNSDNASFLWWLDRNREATVSDIFLPNTGWQQKLASLAVANLRSQPDLKDVLDEDHLNQWLSAAKDAKEQPGNPHPSGWSITRDGLTITFGQYEIAPYSAGMPQAHIPWTDLKPFLSPTLHPSALPAPIPKTNP